MPRPSSHLSRRSLLGAATAGILAATATGCGLRLGAPEPFEPPEPGADELARRDLLARIDALLPAVSSAGADALDPAVRDELVDGLTVQREQLRTASGATAAAGPASTAPVPAADAAVVAPELVALAARSASSAVNTSPGFARLVSAHSAWQVAAALRTAGPARGAGADGTTAEDLLADLPAPVELEPAEVPATDPPDPPLSAELPSLLESVLDGERRGAYLSEVLAARAEDEARDRHLRARDDRRGRAELVSGWIERNGDPVPAAPVGYELPNLEGAAAAAADREAAAALVSLWVPVAGAADPADRGTGLAAVLDEAAYAAVLGARLSPAPGLAEEDEG